MKYRMMNNETTTHGNHKLYRIKALIDIPSAGVKAGDFGGFIGSEKNLSQDGNCWVGDDAHVFSDARIQGDAQIMDNASVGWGATVCGNAKIKNNAQIRDNALISGNAIVQDNAWVTRFARVKDNALIGGDAQIGAEAWIEGDTQVVGNSRVHGHAWLAQGRYTTGVIGLLVDIYYITAVYPNHVQVGCKLFEICSSKQEASKKMLEYGVEERHHNRMWQAIEICQKWLKDNPEKK